MACKKYFITATGTDIGKTFVTAALTQQLRAQGKTVTAIKPVISGFDPARIEESDTGILLQSQGLPVNIANALSISPWQFREPISPDMAAENEKRLIDFTSLTSYCRTQEKNDYLLVEGAGGIMTPVGQTHTMLDWINELGYSVIIVGGSYLGCISHILTTFQAALSRRLVIHSIIISESATSPVPPERTLLTLQRFLPNNIASHCITRNDGADTFAEIVL